MCGVWRGYDVAGIGGGEFALRLVSRQRVAPLYWRSDIHTHTLHWPISSLGEGGMFMFHRQMGGQMDSEMERAGDFWERGSVVASLYMHSCALMFMFFFMQANGWVGEQ
jgi:hypothetical protein